MSLRLGSITCSLCDAVFIITSTSDDDDLARALDAHVQDHHGALVALVATAVPASCLPPDQTEDDHLHDV